MGLCIGLLTVWLLRGPVGPGIAQGLPRSFDEPVEAYQLTILSDADEVALGERLDAQLKSQEGLIAYNPDSDLATYVDAVGQRLAAVSDRPEIPYRFQVIEGPNINAFATVGGYVYVTTALLQAAQNEAELAAVLAHEIGHIAGRHSLDQLWHELTISHIYWEATPYQRAIAAAAIDFRLRSHSQEDEYDADRRGVHTLLQAGYAPSGAITLLRRVSVDAAEITRTHPTPARRLIHLQALIAAANVPEAIDGLDEEAYRERISPLIAETDSN